MLEWNYASQMRGGGTGGFGKDAAAERSASEKAESGLGEIKMNLSATGGNSILRLEETASDFFSDFLAAAMALHMQQGCRPSKVSDIASDMECVRRFEASMVAHATVCSAVQCSPVVKTSAKTMRHFPPRANIFAE